MCSNAPVKKTHFCRATRERTGQGKVWGLGPSATETCLFGYERALMCPEQKQALGRRENDRFHHFLYFIL